MAQRTERTKHAAIRPFFAWVAALALAAALLALVPPAAWADAPSTQSSPVTDVTADELQQRVEDTANAYNEAVAQREAVEQQVADCQARIAELEARLPVVQDQASEALYTLYRFQQNGNGLVELLLSADDFNSFITTLWYLNSVNSHNVGMLEELSALTSELTGQKEQLDAALLAAQDQEEAAKAALAEAQAAREEAQRRAEEARRQAEEAAALAAANAAAAASASAASGSTETAGAVAADGSSDGGAATDGAQSSDEGSSDAPAQDSGSSGGEVNWQSDRDIFIAEWGARINAYLSGSTLDGYGATFAAAAWDYGVDPRWSPAIAYCESTLGAYCFMPHNAWGWGSVSWDSWEEAIYGHVAGLARGYGYTISYDAAMKYCPSNADYWYSVVSTQMSYM